MSGNNNDDDSHGPLEDEDGCKKGEDSDDEALDAVACARCPCSRHMKSS